MNEWTPPVTRLHCPLCPWTVDDPGRGHGIEAIVRAHLETHPLEEWTREVARLRWLVPPPAPDHTAVPWRVGRRKGRNLYAVTGPGWESHPQIGCLDSAGLAEAACAAHNADLIRRKAGEAP